MEAIKRYFQIPAVLAPAIRNPVLAVARAAVLALVLLAPVLKVARAAVLAPVLLAPVLATELERWRCIFVSSMVCR